MYVLMWKGGALVACSDVGCRRKVLWMHVVMWGGCCSDVEGRRGGCRLSIYEWFENINDDMTICGCARFLPVFE